jgi:hypothetical protein
MDEWKQIAEQAIRQAMEEGKFDRLPGAGQPLNLDENPYEDPARWAANHLLRNNGFSPPWIEERRSLEWDIQRARLDLLRAWQWTQVISVDAAGGNAHWRRALGAFGEQVEALNRRLRDYNLKAPAGIPHLAHLVVEDEVRRVQGE